MDRRDFLVAGAASASALVMGSAAAHADPSAMPMLPKEPDPSKTSLKGAFLDLTTPEGNREASARINGNTQMGETKFGWFKGVVHGVRPGEGVRDLVGFSGFSAARLLPTIDPDYPGYRKVLREVGFYTDLETGEILEHWDNPYLNERVRVVPIANDPFNSPITAYLPPAPKYGGLNTVERERTPLLLDWTRRDNRLTLARRINLFYPSALQPDKWPRESSGKFNRVSEMFLYNLSWDDMQDPTKTSVEAEGVWNRITPWLPWMLMGPTPGHCFYSCFFGATDSLEYVDRNVLEYAAKHYPKYFEAPETWEEPSLSSLEWYAREQQPAPIVDGVVPVAPEPKLPF